MVNSDNTHDRRSFSGFKNRILLIGLGILLILTLGTTFALRYSLPQRIFTRVRLKAPLVVSELGRFAPGADDPGYAKSLLQEVGHVIDALDKVL